MPKDLLVLVYALSVCVIPGCWFKARRTMMDTRFDENKSLFASIKTADRLVPYEGLPHQFYEGALLKQERAKGVVEFHSFPFYPQPLELKSEDTKRLCELLGEEGSFRQYAGSKACGGYHPDYCVEWSIGDRVYHCQICLGCHEVKVYGPSGELYCDIAHDAYQQLKDVLKPFRKNRPVSEYNRQ